MAADPDTPSILVGWDGSEHADDALELGRVLARATDAQLVVAEVTVDRLRPLHRRRELFAPPVPPVPGTPGTIDVEPRGVISSSPADGLHDLAEEISTQVIVIGSTHRGPAGRVFLGSVADGLIHGAPCAVAIAPRGYAKRYATRLIRVVMVGFDASPEARVAAAQAARIASAAGASLRVVAVLEPPPPAAMNPVTGFDLPDVIADEEGFLQRELAELVQGLPPDIKPEGQVVHGDIARSLGALTAEDVDLLVVGSRGYGPLGRTVLGSVSSRIIRSATCPVLVVPRGASES
jgi:nucleotide-binding universal stress UspA family protein